jgi:uncharacterized Zn finger protein (UPF0148 family)
MNDKNILLLSNNVKKTEYCEMCGAKLYKITQKCKGFCPMCQDIPAINKKVAEDVGIKY